MNLYGVLSLSGRKSGLGGDKIYEGGSIKGNG